LSIIKHVTLQKIVAHDFQYDPRTYCGVVGMCRSTVCVLKWLQTELLLCILWITVQVELMLVGGPIMHCILDFYNHKIGHSFECLIEIFSIYIYI
jgi:hypothetical protein